MEGGRGRGQGGGGGGEGREVKMSGGARQREGA